MVDPVDDTYLMDMNRQLTVQESRHKLARDVCHGKRGTIHQAYRDGMEDQLGALGLVLNAVVLWTTRYLDAAVDQLRAERPATRGGRRQASPPKTANLANTRSAASTAIVLTACACRPLRDPDAPKSDEDYDGGQQRRRGADQITPIRARHSASRSTMSRQAGGGARGCGRRRQPRHADWGVVEGAGLRRFHEC